MLVGMTIGVALVTGSQQPDDVVSTARAFLAAFASSPQSTRALAADDALFVAIDVGGPYAELLKVMGDTKPALATCDLTSLEQQPDPSFENMDGFPAASFKTPGHFTAVKGTYACKRDDGKPTVTIVNLVFKDGRMVLFGMAPQR